MQNVSIICELKLNGLFIGQKLNSNQQQLITSLSTDKMNSIKSIYAMHLFQGSWHLATLLIFLLVLLLMLLVLLPPSRNESVVQQSVMVWPCACPFRAFCSCDHMMMTTTWPRLLVLLVHGLVILYAPSCSPPTRNNKLRSTPSAWDRSSSLSYVNLAWCAPHPCPVFDPIVRVALLRNHCLGKHSFDVGLKTVAPSVASNPWTTPPGC